MRQAVNSQCNLRSRLTLTCLSAAVGLTWWSSTGVTAKCDLGTGTNPNLTLVCGENVGRSQAKCFRLWFCCCQFPSASALISFSSVLSLSQCLTQTCGQDFLQLLSLYPHHLLNQSLLHLFTTTRWWGYTKIYLFRIADVCWKEINYALIWWSFQFNFFNFTTDWQQIYFQYQVQLWHSTAPS